jgi:hypothetical protein
MRAPIVERSRFAPPTHAMRNCCSCETSREPLCRRPSVRQLVVGEPPRQAARRSRNARASPLKAWWTQIVPRERRPRHNDAHSDCTDRAGWDRDARVGKTQQERGTVRGAAGHGVHRAERARRLPINRIEPGGDRGSARVLESEDANRDPDRSDQLRRLKLAPATGAADGAIGGSKTTGPLGPAHGAHSQRRFASRAGVTTAQARGAQHRPALGAPARPPSPARRAGTKLAERRSSRPRAGMTGVTQRVVGLREPRWPLRRLQERGDAPSVARAARQRPALGRGGLMPAGVDYEWRLRSAARTDTDRRCPSEAGADPRRRGGRGNR